MIVLLAGLALAACVSPAFAAVNAVQDTTWNTWSNTVYYFGRLMGPNHPYGTVTIHVTAVDKYTLYINGIQIDRDDRLYGTDDNDWSTVDTYTWTASADTLYVSAKVENSGQGHGNGFMVDIDPGSGSDWLGTTTMRRRIQTVDSLTTKGEIIKNRKEFPVQWYYCEDSELPSLMATTAAKMSAWYSKSARLFVNAGLYINGGYLHQAMLGNINSLNYTTDSHIEIIAGYSGDLDVGSLVGGGLSLRSVEGENLALAKPGDNVSLMDGDLATGYSYSSTVKGKTSSADLERDYLVNKMVLYTVGGYLDKMETNSVLAYSAEISRDKNAYETVGSIFDIGVSNADNGGYDYAEVTFPAQTARYVRYKILADRPTSKSVYAYIGEMMVFGTGYAGEGTYTSPWFDAGSTATKNFGTVEWEGTLLGNTSIEIQTQTVSYDSVMSDWSPAHTAKSFSFDSPEPARKFRYRVRMLSGDPNVTPTLTSLKVSYSESDQPLLWGRGQVAPVSVPMNVDTTFTYTFSYKLAAGQNIKTLAIAVPSYSAISSMALIQVDSTGLKTPVKNMVATTDYTVTATRDSLIIAFVDTLADAGGVYNQLVVTFKSRLLVYEHEFSASVMNSRGNDGAGPMGIWEETSASWKTTASTIENDVLINVLARPKVLSPNGDSKNDFTVIEFTLAKVSARVKINIFSADGTRVRKLYNEHLTPSAYTYDNAPGRWDGKDDDGDLVPPGIYIYQVIADTDGGDKVKTGTVVVAY